MPRDFVKGCFSPSESVTLHHTKVLFFNISQLTAFDKFHFHRFAQQIDLVLNFRFMRPSKVLNCCKLAIFRLLVGKCIKNILFSIC